jgi:hypothetical protein
MQRLAGRIQSIILVLLSLGVVFLVSSCGDVTEEEAIQNYETILALTPTKTPTFTPTNTPTLTPSPTLSPTPSPTLAPTKPPTPTPLPPTPTSNPALQDFSFCNQTVGDEENGRFSARLIGDMHTETFPAFERLTLSFELAEESAPLSAISRLVNDRDYTQITGDPVAPAPYMLMIDFPGWLHDGFFTSTIITGSTWLTETASYYPTYLFTDTDVLKSFAFTSNLDSPAGTTFLLGLAEPALYHVALSRDLTELRVEIAREAFMTPSQDELAIERGDLPLAPDPLYFLLNGDIWQLDGTDVYSITQLPEYITDIAISPDSTLLAYCRTQEPGINPRESGAAVPASLWIRQLETGDEQTIPDLGVNCTDLVFSPDSSLLAMSVDETGISPTERSMHIVSVSALLDAHSKNGSVFGEPPTSPITDSPTLSDAITMTNTLILTDTIAESATNAAAETQNHAIRGGGWNRFAPQWLNDSRLVYAAQAPDARSTIFILDLDTGIEHDVGGDIQVVDSRYRYRAFGAPLVSPDGRAIAIEAYRADEPGADMLLLDATGKEQDVVQQGYWTRPLAWSEDQTLFYLVTNCDSTLIQDYALSMYERNGKQTLLAAGKSLGTIGEAVAMGDGLAYVSASRALFGARGPERSSPYSPSAIWYWNLDEQHRGVLHEVRYGITRLTR